MNNGLVVRVAALALLVATIAGCAGVPTPREWEALLDEVRAFERRIGFKQTNVFLDFSAEQGRYPFCGQVSRLYLPYSYEDPAIRWLDAATEHECRTDADGADVYFETVEAWGEVGTPVTFSMLGGKLDRFLYLIIHEDCHEQFELPYGVEEALCNLIAYKAMAVFSEEKYGPAAREHVAIRRYVNVQSERTRTIRTLYEQLAGHYARYERKEISSDALLEERARIFSKAERLLAWKRGSLNNVGMANEMTYSRHYPFLESVFDALGHDLARTVAFFKRVDAMKPSPREVTKRHRIAADNRVGFLRAYEAEVVRTIERALAEATRQ